MVTTLAVGDSVCIEVADECGGLIPGAVDGLFSPFEQRNANRTGLGLAICRRGSEANGGKLSVREVQGEGCVFSVALPRHEAPGVAA